MKKHVMVDTMRKALCIVSFKWFFTLMIMFSFIITICSSADAEIASGSFGQLTWILDDSGMLTISGSTEMDVIKWDQNEAWLAYKDDIKTVVIAEGVKSIGSYAFKDCDSLTEVLISTSVTSLGYNCFSECDALQEVVIPSSITSIKGSLFSNCSNLRTLFIPDSVNSLGNSICFLCYKLKSVHLPSGITAIGANDYYGCIALEEINIPDGVVSIGKNAFLNCSSLKNIVIPDSVKYIDDSSFSGCSGITELDLPSDLRTIGERAFSGCSGLTHLTIPASVKSSGYYAFATYSKNIDVYYLGTWTDFVKVAFSGLNSNFAAFATRFYIDGVLVQNLVIPESIEKIPDFAFYNYSGLRSVVLPKSIISIEKYTFADCKQLASITIPDCVTEIKTGAFDGCDSLTGIIIPICNSYAHNWAKANGFGVNIIEHGQIVTDEAVKPSCTEAGLTEGKHCSVCGEVIVSQKMIPILILGDINNDMVVDGRDVIHLMKYLAGDIDEDTGKPYTIYIDNADFNKDGTVNELDLLRLMRFLAGDIPEL